MKTDDGRLIVVGGASRSGKTAWVRKATAKARRVFAWDPEDQWAELRGWRKVTNRRDLLALARKPGAMKLAYVAGGDLGAEFEYFCSAAYASTRYTEATDVIAEELADVSSPAKAPASWGILLRRGLKRGGSIYAISQRWQEADKTALGNATRFVFFRQNGVQSARYLYRMTGVPEGVIPSEPLHFVEFDPTTGETRADRLRF